MKSLLAIGILAASSFTSLFGQSSLSAVINNRPIALNITSPLENTQFVNGTSPIIKWTRTQVNIGADPQVNITFMNANRASTTATFANGSEKSFGGQFNLLLSQLKYSSGDYIIRVCVEKTCAERKIKIVDATPASLSRLIKSITPLIADSKTPIVIGSTKNISVVLPATNRPTSPHVISCKWYTNEPEGGAGGFEFKLNNDGRSGTVTMKKAGKFKIYANCVGPSTIGMVKGEASVEVVSNRSSDQPTGMGNPASINCIRQGGRSEIVKDSKGNESGYCAFRDGRKCEEWALFSDKKCIPPSVVAPTSYRLDLKRSGTGSGIFTLTGYTNEGREVTSTCTLSDGNSCYTMYKPSQVATLKATPLPGSTFNGWSFSSPDSGRCDGTTGCKTSTVKMDKDQTVTAVFNTDPTTPAAPLITSIHTTSQMGVIDFLVTAHMPHSSTWNYRIYQTDGKLVSTRGTSITGEKTISQKIGFGPQTGNDIDKPGSYILKLCNDTNTTCSNGLPFTLTNPSPSVAIVPLPTSTLDNGTKSIFRLKVTAGSNGLSLNNFAIRIATTTVKLSPITTYVYIDSNYSIPASGLGLNGLVTTPSNVWTAAGDPISINTNMQIPAGQTRYFDITASVSGATAGASVSTSLVELFGVTGTTVISK